MKMFNFSIIALIACCFISSVATAAERVDERWAVSDEPFVYIDTPSGKFSYINTAEKFLSSFEKCKVYRVTQRDFEIATRQAETFVTFLMSQSGMALLHFFSRPGVLEAVIQKGQEHVTVIERGISTGINLVSFGLLSVDITIARERGCLVMQQFLEHHATELISGKNLNLLRAIFQIQRLIYLRKELFKSYEAVFNNKHGLRPVLFLSMEMEHAYLNIDSRKMCLAMFRIFQIFVNMFNYSRDNEQELFESFLTREEKAVIESRIAAGSTVFK